MQVPVRPGLQVLASAAALMALEVCGPRLLAPSFGNGTVVWSGVLAATLVAMGAGNLAGGALADRPGRRSGPVGPLLGGAVACAATAWAAPPLARFASEAFPAVPGGQLAALLVACALLFGPAAALLAAVYPLAFREALPGLERAGRTAGWLYALSAVGSLLGALAPPLWTVPHLGTRGSLCLFAVLPALAALTGRGPARLAALPLLPLLLAAALRPAPTPPPLVEAWESRLAAYSLERREGALLLRVETPGRPVLSAWGAGLPGDARPYYPLVLAPFLASPEPPARVLIVGLAGGSAAELARYAFPGAEIHGVEIDATLVDRARRHFGLDLLDLHVHVGDGRAFLRRLPPPWDLVMVDASVGSTPPPHLSSVEFLEEVRERLSPRGVVALYAPPPLNVDLSSSVAAAMPHSLFLGGVAVGASVPLDPRGADRAADRLGWTPAGEPWSSLVHRPPPGATLTDDRGGSPWWWGMRVER